MTQLAVRLEGRGVTALGKIARIVVTVLPFCAPRSSAGIIPVYLEISIIHDPEAMRRRTDSSKVETVRICSPDSATIDVHDGISVGLKTERYCGTPRLRTTR